MWTLKAGKAVLIFGERAPYDGTTMEVTVPESEVGNSLVYQSDPVLTVDGERCAIFPGADGFYAQRVEAAEAPMPPRAGDERKGEVR